MKKPKNPKSDGYWRFLTRCSWDWDGCGMAVTGGMCVYYEPHDGAHITCIADLRQLDEVHPNSEGVPSDDDVRIIEDRLSESWA